MDRTAELELEYSLLTPTATAADAQQAAAMACDRGITRLLVTTPLLEGISAEVQDRLRVASVCGYPSGKHHPLIKATEARFAVQSGASEIVVVPDLASIDTCNSNALLSELITIREAVTEQVRLSVVLDAELFATPQIHLALTSCAQAGVNSVTLPISASNKESFQATRKLAEQLAEHTPNLGLRVLSDEKSPDLSGVGAAVLTVPFNVNELTN